MRGLLNDSLSSAEDEQFHLDKGIADRIEYRIRDDLSRGDQRMAVQGLPSESSSVNQPALSSQPLASERQRLETQQINMQAEWQTRTEKLAQLRLALAIETSAAKKFQLEQEVKTEEAEITRLETLLANLEQALAHNSGASTVSDIP